MNTHVHAKPGTHNKCELGPRRLVITPSINQWTKSSAAVFFFPLFSRSQPFLLLVASQYEAVSRCAWRLYLSVLPGAFTAGTALICFSFSCELPSISRCEVEKEPVQGRETDRQADSERWQLAAAAGGLETADWRARRRHSVSTV